MKTYQIHFIRHGLTDGNLTGKYIGGTDMPLCERGEAELCELAQKHDYPGAGAYFSSPLQRCTKSLEILYPDIKPIIINELRECCFGDFEGLTADELKGKEDFEKWMSAPADFAPPGGESGEQFAVRISEAFEAIVNGLLKTGITSAVIMTHGGVISALLSKYGLPQADPSEWYCEPGCGFSVRVHPQLWMTGNVVEVYSRLPLEKQAEEDDEE